MSIIAISRETFSGGEALAKRLAERLQYRCLSRETNLETAAQRYMVPAEELTAAMEKRPTFWERMVGERAAYLAFVRAALCEEAQGATNLSRLSGTASAGGHFARDQRAGNCRCRLPPSGSARTSRRTPSPTTDGSSGWTRFLFEVDWEDAHLYDLVLNLSRMSLNAACETVVQLTEQDEFKPNPASLKAMEDLTLHSQVAAALAMDFRTRGADLRVTADDGIVTVTGRSRWPEVADAVPVVVRRVAGVKAVKCEITGISPPSPLTWY
jgi:cytidylate kinase